MNFSSQLLHFFSLNAKSRCINSCAILQSLHSANFWQFTTILIYLLTLFNKLPSYTMLFNYDIKTKKFIGFSNLSPKEKTSISDKTTKRNNLKSLSDATKNKLSYITMAKYFLDKFTYNIDKLLSSVYQSISLNILIYNIFTIT